MCGFIPFITTVAILANSFTLVGIAVDRYWAIIRLIKGTWEPNKLFCAAGAVFVWGLAAGISSPMISSYYIAEFYIIHTDPENRSHMIDVTEAEMCVSEKVKFSTNFNVTFIFYDSIYCAGTESILLFCRFLCNFHTIDVCVSLA